MKFSFSEEQEQFRTSVRRFLERHSPSTEVRRLMATADGYDAAVWRGLSEDLGLTGLHVPEAYGGAGFGMGELGIALEEMGRALLCAPYFSSAVLAGYALINTATETEKNRRLPALARGEEIATLALAETAGRWDCAAIALTASHSQDGYLLNGGKHFVLDGCRADSVLVAARAPGTRGDDGISLFAVAATAAGLARRPLEVIDPTRKLAALEFDHVPATLISAEGSAAGALTRSLDQARIALAHEMMGGAQALFDSAVAYAGLRMQFGRVIGSFQAIKHRCADLLLEIELAKAAVYYAAAAWDDGDTEVAALACMAKACAADAYMNTAAACIQIHGGIGFTWDHDTHLWFKRAKSSEVLLGGANELRERYIQLQAASA